MSGKREIMWFMVVIEPLSSVKSLFRALWRLFRLILSSLAVVEREETTLSQVRWLPPPPSWLKNNIDAAVRSDFSVVAGVVRNSGRCFSIVYFYFCRFLFLTCSGLFFLSCCVVVSFVAV